MLLQTHNHELSSWLSWLQGF